MASEITAWAPSESHHAGPYDDTCDEEAGSTDVDSAAENCHRGPTVIWGVTSAQPMRRPAHHL